MGIMNSIRETFSLPKLPKIGVVDSVCPYCNKELQKKPGKKKKCPHCGKYIYVRTRPQDKKQVLVTEDQAELIEEQWSIVNGTHDEYLARRRTIEEERTRLAKQFGREPSEKDVQWALLNKEVLKHASDGDWGLYRNARFQMAEILRKESKLNQALSMYFWVCYLDLNGPRNTGGVKDPDLLRDYPPFSSKGAFLAPGVISRITRLLDKLTLDHAEIMALFEKAAEHDYKGLKLSVSPSDAWQKLKKELFAQQDAPADD
jgi:DNA-directed RNA polymerase subunit RPC12/RpoP